MASISLQWNDEAEWLYSQQDALRVPKESEGDLSLPHGPQHPVSGGEAHMEEGPVGSCVESSTARTAWKEFKRGIKFNREERLSLYK